MLMRRNVAAGIGSNEQGEYCRAALQRCDRKEPRYKWPTLLYFYRMPYNCTVCPHGTVGVEGLKTMMRSGTKVIERL